VDEALDPYRITDKLEDVLLGVMVSRLEARGKHWFFQKVLRDYVALGQCATRSLRQWRVFRREQLLHLYCKAT
jgi:hypothetical protein